MVHGDGLENRFPFYGNTGSNPVPSASSFHSFVQARFLRVNPSFLIPLCG